MVNDVFFFICWAKQEAHQWFWKPVAPHCTCLMICRGVFWAWCLLHMLSNWGLHAFELGILCTVQLADTGSLQYLNRIPLSLLQCNQFQDQEYPNGWGVSDAALQHMLPARWRKLCGILEPFWICAKTCLVACPDSARAGGMPQRWTLRSALGCWGGLSQFSLYHAFLMWWILYLQFLVGVYTECFSGKALWHGTGFQLSECKKLAGREDCNAHHRPRSHALGWLQQMLFQLNAG